MKINKKAVFGFFLGVIICEILYAIIKAIV